MIAVDTNILVYGHRKDSEWNEIAHQRLAELAGSRATWAIPWPCIHEFLSVVTHPRIFSPPSSLEQALDQVSAWLECPSLALLSEEGDYWPCLEELVRDAKLRGPAVHDARIAALCRLHGVHELWSADRDFSRLQVKVRNPLIA
ncbi:MAG: PIN domain-containing protein [Deltaproteobacteria bacterium]